MVMDGITVDGTNGIIGITGITVDGILGIMADGMAADGMAVLSRSIRFTVAVKPDQLHPQ
jgi:hypothetical protein